MSFRDLPSGETLPERVENTTDSVVFAADSKTVFYTAMDDNLRPSKVCRRQLGSGHPSDELVYEEPDPGFFVNVPGNEDDAHIVISSYNVIYTEIRTLCSNESTAEPQLLAKRETGVEYEVSSLGDGFLILTNDGAEDLQLMQAPLDGQNRSCWIPLVPHRTGFLIVAATTLSRFIVRLAHEAGLPRIVIRSRADGKEHSIEFKEQVYSFGISPGYEYDTATLRFTYSSLTPPQQVFEYNLVTRERRLLQQQEIPSGHGPAE